jgi:hypothetical protein
MFYCWCSDSFFLLNVFQLLQIDRFLGGYCHYFNLSTVTFGDNLFALDTWKFFLIIFYIFLSSLALHTGWLQKLFKKVATMERFICLTSVDLIFF